MEGSSVDWPVYLVGEIWRYTYKMTNFTSLSPNLCVFVLVWHRFSPTLLLLFKLSWICEGVRKFVLKNNLTYSSMMRRRHLIIGYKIQESEILHSPHDKLPLNCMNSKTEIPQFWTNFKKLNKTHNKLQTDFIYSIH